MRIVRIDTQDTLTGRQRSALAQLVADVADEVGVADVAAWKRQDLVVYTVQDYDGPDGRRRILAPRSEKLSPGDEVVGSGWMAARISSGTGPPHEPTVEAAGALIPPPTA